MAGRFFCPDCAAEYPLDTRAWRCLQCRGALAYEGVKAAFPKERIASRPATLWRYAEALPTFAAPIGLGEPVTPLVDAMLNGRRIRLKCDICMPTGSYKDRGAALLINHLKASGITAAVEDSSGNAGAAMAAYAARAGIALKVFCPDSAAAGKLAQIRLYGAQIAAVPGPRIRATEALMADIEHTGAYYASHLWHPLFIEGIKTLAYEMTEQLAWTAPDVVACPVGAGSILLGLYAGFKDLLAAGVIDRLPRLVAVQSQHVAPLYQAFRAGATAVERIAAPQPTLAEGIALPAPVRGAALLAALQHTAGQVVAVSEEDIAAGVVALGRQGFCVEPTAAVVWKGLERYLAAEDLPATASVTAVLSGHGLKATAALSQIAASGAM